MYYFETGLSSNMNAKRNNSVGQALVAALGVVVVLGILVSLALSVADFTHGSTTREGRTQQAIQAADSALNQYIGRLVEDPYYYLHYVDNAEDTRTVGATSYAANAPFSTSGASAWTYSGPPQRYIPLVTDDKGDAVRGPYGLIDYSLRVRPSDNGLDTAITATGRVGGTGPGSVIRSVEATVRPQSVSDFQVIGNGTEQYSSLAQGKIMIVNGDLIMVNDGTTSGFMANDAYATGHICSGGPCGSTSTTSTFFDPARKYYASDTSPTYSQKYKTPVDFSLFSKDLQNTKDFADGAGTHPAAHGGWGWLIQFTAGGKYNLWQVNSTWNPQASAAPTSAQMTQTVYNAPLPSSASGTTPVTVFYFDQPVVVSDATKGRSSVVGGKVTLVSGSRVFFGGDVSYEDPAKHVLGVISQNDVTITRSTGPGVTNIAASLIAVDGQFTGAECSFPATNVRLNFLGTRVENTGCMSNLFQARTWTYDTNRQNFVPPLFPVLQGSYQVQSFREVNTPG